MIRKAIHDYVPSVSPLSSAASYKCYQQTITLFREDVARIYYGTANLDKIGIKRVRVTRTDTLVNR